MCDPDDPGRSTFWLVEHDRAGGRLVPFPAGVRWAPYRPAYPPGVVEREERRAWSHAWYEDHYHPWKAAVIDAIADDPDGAAARFLREAPLGEFPKPVRSRSRSYVPRPRKVTAKQLRLAAEALMAQALAAAGSTEREIGAALGLPKTTAHRRVWAEPQAAALRAVLATVILGQRLRELQHLAEAAESPADVERLRVRAAEARALYALLAAGDLDGDAALPRAGLL